MNYKTLDFSENTILSLHSMLLSYTNYQYGGKYKDTDNVILEIDANGNRSVRFCPTPASETPKQWNSFILPIYQRNKIMV